MTDGDSRPAQKRAAAEAAANLVESRMVVGLGTGSTAVWAIRSIGAALRDGRVRDVVGIPTSTSAERDAIAAGIPLTTLAERPTIDLTIDGADEVDPDLNLVKGHGGALLREKIVAQASRREVIVVDDSKPSPALGTRMSVPVEVIRFACTAERAFLEDLGAVVTMRGGDDAPYVTDEGNWILDAGFGPIADPVTLSAHLHERAGIVEHGLFLGLTHDCFVATDDGVTHLTNPVFGR